MSTLKKSAIATITATALATGICTPAANAAAVKVNGDTCVLTFTDYEQQIQNSKTLNTTRQEARDSVTDIELTLETQLKDYDQAYARHEISEAEYKKATKEIKEIHKAYRTTLPALRACAASKDMPASSAEFEAFMSAPNGKELSDAGIGIVAASAVVVVLAGLVAALPQIKPMFPANIQAMLP